MNPSRSFVRVLFVHLGFHTLFVIAYFLALSGNMWLIPITGSYIAFLLGFLGQSVIASPSLAAFLGFVVFGFSGYCSARFARKFRFRGNDYALGFCSLVITISVLTSFSSARRKMFGMTEALQVLQGSVAENALGKERSGVTESFSRESSFLFPTGRLDGDTLSWVLKGHAVDDVPLYAKGEPNVTTLEEIKGELTLLPADFVPFQGGYYYCNLPPQTWKTLKQTNPKRYLLCWSQEPDPQGKHLVIVVDLRNDQFPEVLLGREGLLALFGELTTAVRDLGDNAALVMPDP